MCATRLYICVTAGDTLHPSRWPEAATAAAAATGDNLAAAAAAAPSFAAKLIDQGAFPVQAPCGEVYHGALPVPAPGSTRMVAPRLDVPWHWPEAARVQAFPHSPPHTHTLGLCEVREDPLVKYLFCFGPCRCIFEEKVEYSVDADSGYTDRVATSKEECCNACGLHSGCEAFVFEPSSGTCVLLPQAPPPPARRIR